MKKHLISVFIFCLFCTFLSAQKRPNVVIVLTDDKGIGDLACHGNPWIKTPNLDSFYKESVRLTDFLMIFIT